MIAEKDFRDSKTNAMKKILSLIVFRIKITRRQEVSNLLTKKLVLNETMNTL
jgi:hypothetical protein